VQNAVGFARQRVWIDALYSNDRVVLRIIDDGDGFPPQVIGRIGDPFLRSKPGQEHQERPGYEGMGLGLFIAKTLLERTGAALSFANASDPFLSPEERPERGGAVVEVIWPRDAIEVTSSGALGENPANIR
jgi:two-component system sensor histidine kinase RegB